MKIACSSASFARSLEDGSLTQLEWLDACANELEADGVVFDIAHFPRSDDEYLAQLKKQAADLGLTVAALATDGVAEADRERVLAIASALGAPLVLTRAPLAREDPQAWPDFAAAVRLATRAAKRANVTLAIRNARGTLCASTADLKRLAKDVDSAWLRFALDPAALGMLDEAATLLAKAVIAVHDITDLATFATAGDGEAGDMNIALARFRGFIVLEASSDAQNNAYHAALERFAALRARVFADSATA